MDVRYAKSPEGVHIAYAILGDGPVDLVFLSSWDLAIDFLLDEPDQIRFFDQLASFSRVILFDKRGTGASDSVSLDSMPTLESWVDDVICVMDDVSSERAAILAVTWTGPLGILFAASRPDRTAALVLVDTFARLHRGPELPDHDRGPAFDDSFDGAVEAIEAIWGTGNFWGAYAPSLAGDERLRRWWNRCQRLTLSPASAVAFTRMMADSDVRSTLPLIQAPTLVVSGENPDRDAEAQYLADHIADARRIRIPGHDTLPWLNETLGGDIEEFLTGARTVDPSDRLLATVLFTDIVDSTRKATELGDRRWNQLLGTHDALVRRALERHRGRHVSTSGDGHLATFDGPARAIRCAQSICSAVRSLGIEVRAGLHTGEIERRGDDIGGIAVHIGQRVSALAGPGEVLVSRTVTDLVAGSGLEFEERGEHELKGVPGKWAIYAVKA